MRSVELTLFMSEVTKMGCGVRFVTFEYQLHFASHTPPFADWCILSAGAQIGIL